MRRCENFLETITRRKPWDVRSLHHTELARSLNLLELTSLGVGSCAGLAIFVTSAHVAKHEAGAAVVLSVLVAGLAALLSGLCHIELATRIPRSGTGYTFCYMTFGELLAFVIGWSVILENVINGAVAAKAGWRYLEFMYDCTGDSNITHGAGVTEGQMFESNPDVIPCCIVIAIAIFLTLTTIKAYAIVSFVLVSFSALVVVAFICVGFFHVDSENWNSPPGFFSQGFYGVMSGAALMMSMSSCVDNLASSAEESRTPCKSLPTAFSLVMSTTSAAIFLVTLALTLATPWQQLSINAALARAYEIKGIFAGKYVIGSGAIFGLIPVIIGSFLRPVRLMYSMSTDSLLPRIFSRIAFHGLPLFAHFTIGVCIAVCALFLDLTTLLEVSSMATIMQFITSSVILLCIRYQPLAVGITREYYVPNIPTNGEEALESKYCLEFQEIGPKLVLLTGGEHKVHRNEECMCTPNCTSPKFSTALSTATVATNGVAFKTSLNDESYQQVWPSSLTSIRRIPNPKGKITKNISSEKNNLRNGYLHSGRTTYGLNDNAGSERVLTNISYLQIRGSSQTKIENSSQTQIENSLQAEKEESTQKQTLIVILTNKMRFMHTCVNNRFISNWSRTEHQANEKTWSLTRYFLLTYVLSSVCFSVTCQAWYSQLGGTWWVVTLTCCSLGLMLISSLLINRQPQNMAQVYFKTPHVPFVPLISVVLNMLLLASLPVLTWVRFVSWLAPGLLVYFCYSCRHSSHRELDDQEVVLFDISQLPSSN